MKNILENNVDSWGLTWVQTVEQFGKVEERELVPNGRNIAVTN